MPRGSSLEEKPVHHPFHTQSQHGSTEDDPSLQLSIFTPTHRDGAAPGDTETLPGPPSHQTPLKAGLAPESLALGPPNTLAGFVCVSAAMSHRGG